MHHDDQVLIFFFFNVGIESKALHMLGKHSLAEMFPGQGCSLVSGRAQPSIVSLSYLDNGILT